MEKTARNLSIEPFSPEVTVVAFGIVQHHGEDTKKVAEQLIQDGMGLHDLPIVRAIRLGSRDSKPGLLKIELPSKDDKIKVLQNKSALQKVSGYSRVYIRSSQTHAERLIQLNFKTILNEMPNGGEYRVTGNGRLVRKQQVFEEQTDRNRTREDGGVSDGKLTELSNVKSRDKLQSFSNQLETVQPQHPGSVRSNTPGASRPVALAMHGALSSPVQFNQMSQVQPQLRESQFINQVAHAQPISGWNEPESQGHGNYMSQPIMPGEDHHMMQYQQSPASFGQNPQFAIPKSAT